MSARKFAIVDPKVVEENRFYSVSGVRVANEAKARRENGAFWFGKAEMRAFGTKITSGLYGGRYFVTSEWANFAKTARAYTVREAEADGSIETIGGFLAYPNQKAAVNAIKALIGAGK